MGQSMRPHDPAEVTPGWGADLRAKLGDPLAWTNLITAPAHPEHRPQDKRYEFPERGAENHGVDEDTKTEDYYPNQVDGDARLDDEHQETVDPWSELVAANPIPVYNVPNPEVSIQRRVQINDVFGQNEAYSSAAGVVDLASMRQVCDVDDTRTSLLVRLGPSLANIAGTGSNYYYFVLSPTPSFGTNSLILLDTPGMSFYYTDNTKSALWAAIVPRSAYAASNLNNWVLSTVMEYATKVDHDPNEA